MNGKFVIPIALQICFDDLGWHDGRDLRYKGQASRSGIPRDHTVDDYIIINELGRALDQRILAPMCLGDWDKDNILRGEVGLTHDPYGWDRAKSINMEYTVACFNALENSEYIEYAVHSTLHGSYADDGALIHENEYFDKGEDGNRHPIPNSEFDRRLRLFYAIYNSWGFKKEIRVIGSPGGVSATVDKDELHSMSEVVRKYGVKYWHARWANGRPIDDLLGKVRFAAISDKLKILWNAYDVDPRFLSDAYDESDDHPCGLISLHWTNFLRFNPENNFEFLPNWIDYFKRQGEKFGCMLSRDFKFSVDQQMYFELVKPIVCGNVCTLDLSEVLSKNIEDLPNEFYISISEELIPSEISGAQISLYEKQRGFNTYKITYTDSMVKIMTKYNKTNNTQENYHDRT